MRTNVVLCAGRLSVMIAAAMGIGPIEAETMSFFRQLTTRGIDEAIAVAADATGIYVLGGLAVAKYDSRGNELWTRELGPFVSGNIRSIVAAADGTCMLMFA